MKKTIFIVSILLILPPSMFTQAVPFRVAGVSEPPELTGEPKKVNKPSEADRQLFEVVQHVSDENEMKTSLPKLNEFIAEHPEYSDAYFFRATCAACILDSHDLSQMKADVEAAIAHPDRKVYGDTEYYSLLGKIELAMGRYRNAVDDLEKAMVQDFDSAEKMFGSGAVEPEKTSKFCVWNLTDLDSLVAKFPQDYRTWLFRGLYFKFFTTFTKGKPLYEKALQDFQKAALLNPHSPVPPYYIGQIYSKQSFWTPEAWASDAARDALMRKTVQPYTTAIQLDAKFIPAYSQRASTYLNLKLYSKAIKDFDRIVELNPDATGAINDRGIAKMEMGQLFDATLDFKESLSRRKPDDSYLPNLYENLGDTYIKLREYRSAISAYSKALEHRLANDSFLMSVKQIRGLYPEYDSVSDEVLCRKINALFWPEYEYSVVAKRLMEENGSWSISFLLKDLYEKRGDAYLNAADFRHGALDFQRIFKGMPDFAKSTDRWRTIGKGADGDEYFLDVKGAEFPSNAPAHFWIKTVGKKQSTLLAFDMDCKGRRINPVSSASYDSEGKLQGSSEENSGWQPVFPDSIGEQLYNGTCSRSE
jgi:tetratricopeptide (TPR) repeat protein